MPEYAMEPEEASLLVMLHELHEARVAAHIAPVRAQIAAALRRMAVARDLPPGAFDTCDLDFGAGTVSLPDEGGDGEQRGL
jgi:hypothetical protein